MFILKLKQKQEILEIIKDKKLFVFICDGCNEVNLNRKKIIELVKNLPQENIVYIKILDYLCNLEYSKLYIEMFKDYINKTEAILIFSCGVGVQTINKITSLAVHSGCDTFYIGGYKGVNIETTLEYDCVLCGSCYLNYTGGVCPLTSCAKSLLNGPCGGAKNTKCEVDETKDCGWKKIFEKLKKYKSIDKIKNKILINENTTT